MYLPTSLLYTLLLLLPSPSAASEPLPSPSYNASLLWGPYRPNLYLGIRPKVPQSLFMGLMWNNFDEGHRSLRHTCEQNEGMGGYGWSAYDPRIGGTQVIPDVGNKINITTELVKISEGQNRGNWGVRVKGTPRAGAAGLRTSVVFYISMEGMETCANCRLDATEGRTGQRDNHAVRKVVFWSKHPVLGISEIHLLIPKHEVAAVKSINTTEDVLWKSKSLFVDLLKDEAQSKRGNLVLSNELGKGNAHFVQMVFRDHFEFDILYSSHESTLEMTPLDITTEMAKTVDSFTARFAFMFTPTHPFNTEPHLEFAQNMLSNLLGGLGYFYGDSKVDGADPAEYEEKESNFWEKAAEVRKQVEPKTEGPYELFTHVPARSAFPRGFLWDEGFHLLPVLDWDADLALEVVQSWLALMDEDGWIGREQALGPEARSKVPAAFQVQSRQVANPPTLFWIVSRYIDMLTRKVHYSGHDSKYLEQADKRDALLRKLYPLLKRHYEWFRRTQSADVEIHSLPHASLSEGYRWRGRSPEYNLASGLDDYPRAEPPDLTELHVDAICWVGVMARVLSQVADFMQRTDDIPAYQTNLKAITQNLEAVHWSEKANQYCDTRVYDDTHSFVCPKGYISLFPFMTGFIGPDHPHLNATLSLIRDPTTLWTDYGVRSLSPDSQHYNTGDNYWRSPIWININYMILEQLLRLGTTPGPLKARCRAIYRELRQNVVQNVYQNWQSTGFAWEQYNPETGHGQRTQGFTGWTALVVKIMAFPSLEGDDREGVREKLSGLVQDAKENKGLSGAGLLSFVLLGVLVYMNRRKFGSLRRSIERRVRRAQRNS